ncbi:MAG TPA: NAD(+) synthase [Candidatus Acidoferrum sp.]|nr:NAD(+) synthase [Candidatus Acidoferrum sp.]
MNTNAANKLSAEVLEIDAPRVAERIEASIRDCLHHQLKRKGVVLGLSGGIDSSVAGALCVRALGPDHVLGLFMPEAESSPDSLHLARLVADFLGINTLLEDITPILQAAGCYQRRDAAIRSVIPEYQETHKCKIVLPNLLDAPAYPFYSVVVRSPAGVQTRARLTPEAFLGIVAASNFKQRTRKMIEYYHADRLNYAVVGTPNRLEYEQGFFVKNGDGAADLKPIAHLYKTQVYLLAEYLDIPREIQQRQPTTDTYSLDQSQEEFYFAMPYGKMDLCLYARNQGLPADEAGAATGLTLEQAERVYRLIDSKRNATRYLHMHALLVESAFSVQP